MKSNNIDYSPYLADLRLHTEKMANKQLKEPDLAAHISSITSLWNRIKLEGQQIDLHLGCHLIDSLNMIYGYAMVQLVNADKSLCTTIIRVKSEIDSAMGNPFNISH